MARWTVSVNSTQRNGTESGTIEAWNAAYDTAMTLVTDGVRDTITLDVDGSVTTVHPANSGNDGDFAATLDIIVAGRVDLINVLSAPEDQAG